jgi:hypothetical protein
MRAVHGQLTDDPKPIQLLASNAYQVDRPTRPQTEAVRRAVRRLTDQGRAECAGEWERRLAYVSAWRAGRGLPCGLRSVWVRLPLTAEETDRRERDAKERWRSLCE